MSVGIGDEIMLNKMFAEAKKCVSFIYLKNGDNYDPIGTGFFIAVKYENGANQYHTYLVTAKHVIIDDLGEFYPVIYVRLNKTIETSEFIPLDLTKHPILIHDDLDVDIAVVKGGPSDTTYDFMRIPQEIFTTQQIMREFSIKEGDEIFFSGLFVNHPGQQKIQPIIRFGRVALIPEEKIEWMENNGLIKYIDLYLMECQSYGGNSGAPVFFYLNPRVRNSTINLEPTRTFLAGIMKGNFNVGNEVENVKKEKKLYSYQNVGIAAVIPSYKLFEILTSKEAVEQRLNSEKIRTAS